MVKQTFTKWSYVLKDHNNNEETIKKVKYMCECDFSPQSSMSMDVHIGKHRSENGVWFMLIDNYFKGIQGIPRDFMDFKGFQRISRDSKEFQRI